jgi:rRNA processing protein Gar1
VQNFYDIADHIRGKFTSQTVSYVHLIDICTVFLVSSLYSFHVNVAYQSYVYILILTLPVPQQSGSEYTRLKRLGKILHLSKSRSLILKLETGSLPRLRTKIFDNKLRQVGFVFDAFGPVANPYVSIKPTVSEPSALVGRVVYASDEKA